MRKWILAAVSVALAIPAIPAMADPPGWAPAHGWRHHHHRHHDRDDDDYAPPPPLPSGYSLHVTVGSGDDYVPRPRYQMRVISQDDEIYRGDDGRYYCRRSDGTMGLVVGAAAGAIIGNQLARGRSATLATLLGAGAGALVGQSLDKGSLHCE